MKVKNVEIRNPHFRKGTFAELREVVFSYMEPGKKTAALGDMICWLSSIIYIAENYNYVTGHLIVPPFFMEIAQSILREYPHWRVHTKIPDRLANGFPLQQPHIHPVNATAMHLTDLGFLYFAGMMPPNEMSRMYPVLDTDDLELPEQVFKPLYAHRYAVLTPGATSLTRTMPAKIYNGIVEHLLSRNIVPVHLGTTSMEYRAIQPKMDEGYDFEKGVNLIDKTSLLEAVRVMADAEMVIGIDNGLLHLAGMTDTTILFGFTMAGPNQRRINRRFGHTIELYADKEKLPCLFCQENVRFFIDHDFSNCIYKEKVPACITALNIESWKASIDQALEESSSGT